MPVLNRHICTSYRNYLASRVSALSFALHVNALFSNLPNPARLTELPFSTATRIAMLHNGRVEYLQSYLHQAGFMPSVASVFVFCALLRAVRRSMWRVALLALPGTFAHELAHLVVGFLLRAKPHGFSVWPRAHGRAWMLGAVSFHNIGLLNGAWVALAPLLLLPVAWLSLIHVLLRLWIKGQWGWWLLASYLTATALFAALPSIPDIKLGGRSLLLYAAMGGLLWLAFTYS